MAGIIGTTTGLVWASARRDEKEEARAVAVANEAQAQKRLTQIEKSNEIITAIFADLDIREVKEGTEPLEAVLAKRLVKAAGQLDEQTIGDPLVVAGLQNDLGSLCSVWAIRGTAFRCCLKPAKPATVPTAGRPPRHAHSMNNLTAGYLDAGELDLALPLLEETLNLRRPNWAPTTRKRSRP